jgi:anaerobic ribonucleoside-triphosphate reductase activating protein
MFDGSRLNVADTERKSVANGPGQRFVIWVQGCPFRCPGCYNPGFLEFLPRRLVSTDTLVDQILSTKDIEGITLSGGEPMAQAEPLAFVASSVQAAGLSVVCFTGFSLKEIKKESDPHKLKLLRHVDILIDGRFNKSLKSYLPLLGSSNQQIHFLTDRYSERDLSTSVDVEIFVTASGIDSTGVFNSTLIEELERKLSDS